MQFRYINRDINRNISKDIRYSRTLDVVEIVDIFEILPIANAMLSSITL